MANALELNSFPTSGSTNRFQVNPVQNGRGNEDDTFDENTLVQTRRPSKIQPLKSSFRDKERQSVRRETRASFQVTQDSDDSDDDGENLIENDAKYGRSFR